MRGVSLFIGEKEKTLTSVDVYCVQDAVMDSDCSPEIKEVACAILYHFICGKETKWMGQ